MAVIDKGKRDCKIINIAVPGDQNFKLKEIEKITKYQDLRLQVLRFWDVKATITSIVAGVLGIVSEELENNLKTIGMPTVLSSLKEELQGTTFILRRLFGISKSG